MWLGLARAYQGLGKPAAAGKAAQRALDLCPDSADESAQMVRATVNSCLAEIQVWLGELETAMEHARAAVDGANEQQLPVMQHGLASVHAAAATGATVGAMEHHCAEASKLWTECAKQQPQLSCVHKGLGDMKMLPERPSADAAREAARHYSKALRLAPWRASNWVDLSCAVRAERGACEAAAACAHGAIAVEPAVAEHWNCWAVATKDPLLRQHALIAALR